MEQMEQYAISYAPVIIVVLAFIFKNKIFVTPEQLLLMKQEIKKEIREEYATKEIAEEIKDDINEIKNDLKEIRSLLFTNHSD
jgi:hypothetical protein